MKKSNMDLIVGGSILISLVILIAGVLWLKEVSLASKVVSYSVLFPNVGNLQVGDPVLVNGVNKGSVASIYLRGTEVAVIMDIDQGVSLTDSCVFSVQNIGLMGERGIGISLSPRGLKIPVNTKNDSTFVRGKFDTGIAEAMGLLGTVLGEVQVLAANVSSLVESTVGDSAFLSLFEVLVGRLDTITDVAQALLVNNRPLIDNSLRNLSTASTDLKTLLDKNSGRIDAIVANGEQLTSYGLSLIAKVDTLAVSVQNITADIENGRGTLGQIMKDEKFYSELKSTVANLDTLVKEVQGDALKLRVRLGFGKKRK
ncbi:MAG: MCE family protein [Fibrobacter sp.]|nr:MCE family protein [Fibrobacter sp.]